MEKLIMAAQLILGLSILVLVHEFGHYITARWFGIWVEKFYLFFDAWDIKLFKFKKGETEYGIGWLPLGGYVKINGMIDESMDKNFINSEPKPYEFRSKPIWQRMIVILGGIIMNVILGILIFSLHTFYYGNDYIPASSMKYGISADKLGKEVGFQSGDQITAVEGKPVTRLNDIIDNKLITDRNIRFTINRNGSVQDITLPDKFAKKLIEAGPESFIGLRHKFIVDSVIPKSAAQQSGLLKGDSIVSVNAQPTLYYDQFVDVVTAHKKQNISLGVKRGATIISLTAKVDSLGKLGFIQKSDIVPSTEHFSLAKSFVIGNGKAWETISTNLKALKRIFTNEIPANKSLNSFIGIAKAYGGVWDWKSFWGLTGMLSMVLALMNFLPIPALDGGYVIYLIVEFIRGKPLSYVFLERAQTVGMVILFSLMGFALYNDFARFVFN